MEDCEVCAIAISTRLTFGDVSVRGRVPVEIVHSDIAGPLKPRDNGGVYYITYIDDYTGYLCAYSLPDKTALGVLTSFPLFQAMVERAFGCKLQVLRTDGGNEYKDLMGQYLRQSGMVQQVTTPYIPQLNGRAERMYRRIEEMLASMLIDAKIGMRWWIYGLKHACVLWNTGRVFEGVALEERVHKRRVEYSKVQAFGTVCWVRVSQRLKADLTVPKAWKGKLLSINLRGAGYIVLLDGDTGKAVVSRDVVFQRALEVEDSSAARLDSAPPAVVPKNAEVSIPIVDLDQGSNAVSGGNDAPVHVPAVPELPRE